MLIEHKGTRRYLLSALEATPEVIEYSLRDLSDDEADFRPDVSRFNLREVVAHLADWDAIFLLRMQRTRHENAPLLSDIDEEKLAIEHDYSHSSLAQQQELFRQRRAQLATFARELSVEDWRRECEHERAGHLTLEALATLVVLHDAYHSRQIVEWRQLYKAR